MTDIDKAMKTLINSTFVLSTIIGGLIVGIVLNGLAKIRERIHR